MKMWRQRISLGPNQSLNRPRPFETPYRLRTGQNRTQTKEHFIVYYNNASDYKNIQSINEYYTEISEI